MFETIGPIGAIVSNSSCIPFHGSTWAEICLTPCLTVDPYLFSTPLGLGSQQTRDCHSLSLVFHHPRVLRGPRWLATEVSLSSPRVMASFRWQSEISLRFRAHARLDKNVSVAGVFTFQGSRRSNSSHFSTELHRETLYR